MPYKTGKLGGWISENYVAAARLMQWFYSNIEDIMDESICEMSKTPIKKWHKKFLCDWLKQRHLDTLGNVDALRTRVQQYMDQPEGSAVTSRYF